MGLNEKEKWNTRFHRGLARTPLPSPALSLNRERQGNRKILKELLPLRAQKVLGKKKWEKRAGVLFSLHDEGP